MVFSSVEFLCIFLPVVWIGYHILPKKARNIWLLVASLAFYACGGPKHLIYLLSAVVVNFVFGLVIARLADRKHPADERGNVTFHPAAQKAVLAVAVVLNIGSLLYFKYTGMLVETYDGLFAAHVELPDIILPIGISFYTFQCISYIVDVYRREGAVLPDGSVATLATCDPVKFALFISMFPQLLQGPIIRYGEVADALSAPVITVTDCERGVSRFIVGLAKKAIIANTLGEVADKIFEIAPSELGAAVAWLGAILYTLQIYFDFAGYTDMAIGLGHLFGFTFRENFNYPYISKSITEFWRRWHISLSNWFRDYLYIPLGGNRRGNVYVNLLIVFLATGIWHGAAWGFLVWGLWHGLFMLIERALSGRSRRRSLRAGAIKKEDITSKDGVKIEVVSSKTSEDKYLGKIKEEIEREGSGVEKSNDKAFSIKIPAFMKWAYTMLVVTLGWVLFKIEDLPEALSYIKAMFGVGGGNYTAFDVRFFLDRRLAFFLVIAILASVPWAQVLPVKLSARIAEFADSDKRAPRIARHTCLILLLVISFVFIVNTTYSPFIYFQF